VRSRLQDLDITKSPNRLCYQIQAFAIWPDQSHT